MLLGRDVACYVSAFDFLIRVIRVDPRRTAFSAYSAILTGLCVKSFVLLPVGQLSIYLAKRCIRETLL